MKTFWIIAVLLTSSVCMAAQQAGSQRLADSLQRKVDHIEQNAQLAHPDEAPTVMTEEEINEYVASGRVKLPLGVKKVRFEGRSGMLTAVATIDFDEIRGGQRASSPLLALFNGIHTVRVETDAAGSGGQGKVHVRSVSFDGTDVPRMALEFFLSRYVTPKYPNVGMDSVFQLPDRIDIAVIGYHKLTVTQK